MFDWGDPSSTGFASNARYHLDLRFNASTISFYTGNNKISVGEAADGSLVDSRVYITGSEVLKPRNLHIPAGYKFDGYFSDPDFDQEWDGIGKPLNEDMKVYIRLSQLQDVSIYYNVVGKGTVSIEFEAFNPGSEAAKGATAYPDTGYRFVGWYSDEGCTALVSQSETLIPSKSWTEGETCRYYAKFVPATADVTITKTFDGLQTQDLIAQAVRGITFTVKKDGEAFRQGITLSNSDGDGEYTATIEDLTIGDTYTIEEDVTAPQNYTCTDKTIKFNGTETSDGSFTVVTGENVLAVTNKYERQKGNLKIQKEVKDGKGALINTDEPFTFTIQADAALINEVYGEDKEFTVTSDTQQSMAPLTFDEKGKTEVTIQGSGTVTIQNLPTGTYTVTEKNPSDEILDGAYYFKESSCPAEGVKVTVSDGEIETATITNTYKPYKTLTITKSVTGGMGSLEQWFDFTLAAPENIEYALNNDQKTATEGSSFRLKDGSTVTLTKIKEGDTITITEEPLTELGYTFKSTTVESEVLELADKNNGDWTGYTQVQNGIEIKVPVGDEIELGTVTFTNERKEVAPTGLEDDHTKPFGLMVGVAVMAGLALVGGTVVRRRRRWME